MKRFTSHFFAFLLLWVTVGLSAAPITREQARQRAVQFLQAVPGSRQLVAVQNPTKLSPRRKAQASSQNELYYVFNRGVNQGYVIVSGDDETLPVLGYTDEGDYDYNSLPENMRFWLQGYENELAYLAEHPEIMSRSVRRAPEHAAIAPMITTKWNQGDPFNQECPIYTDGKRSITGCVATAMAQVLYYQRAKSVTEIQADIPAYTSANGDNFHVDGIPAGSPIDWDNMLNTYGSSATAKQKLAVAQLMHYCGVAVQMMYTSSSSGANSYRVAEALPKYFGYGSSVRYVYKTGQGLSDDAWDVLLYKELEEGRPFYLSGSNSEAGHAFVCDGHDGNGCFHINWGWGGSSDGYFVLNRLNPSSQGLGGSSGGYSDYPEVVIGFEPENYMERAMPIANANVKKLCVEAFDANDDGVLTFGEAAAVTDLGDVFKGKTTVTTFEELYNFTGLKSLSDSAFAGCTKLTTVKLPKGLKHIGKGTFANCRTLKTIKLPDNLTSIGEGAFQNCRVLPNVTLPAGIERIEDNTFESCLAFTAVELPLGIQHLGAKAFSGCTKLATVTVNSIAPQDITLGAEVFAGIDLSAVTLNTAQGTRAYFSTADQWKDFGNIVEDRTLSRGNFAALETNKKYYLYNVGTGYYLTKGEAYGTQAVVADTDEPMRFELRRSATMAANVYYLYSDDTGNANSHYLFRTSTDSKIGSGIPACFVDGSSLTTAAYWKVLPVEGKTNVYTFQIPSTVSGYKATQYLGVQPDHASNAAVPTYGIYSDILYADYARNCQWMLVPYDEQETAIYQAARQLKNLLAIGKTKRVDTTTEQAAYDNFNSTLEELENAMQRMRRKLNFINFVDAAARPVFVSTYDRDGDGEVSLAEAAAAESIGTEFYTNTSVTDLSDLKYFTGVQYISGNAFNGCTSLLQAVVPESVTDVYYRAFMGATKLQRVELGPKVTSLGDNTFSNCKALKEFRVAVHNPADISLGNNVFSGVTLANAVLYVPQGCKELYAAANVWKNFGEIREMRALAAPKFEVPEANTDYYVYNLGMKRNITKGEAYGTQAVVDLNGFTYQLRRTNSMAADTYYLYAEGSGTTNHVLFRTSTDSKVGQGVKTCFVDGSASASAYWTIAPVEGLENVYTLQVPVKDATYVEGEYLGTDYYHTTDFVYGTRGLYWDINYAENPQGCQWGFISVEAVNQAKAFFALTEQLRALLAVADAKGVDVIVEQSVYDDFDSTEEEITDAIASLRSKLHYIEFADNRARTLSVNRWDMDNDGELSLEEAAAVTDLGLTFRTQATMKNFDELRYFTSLTELPAEAFRGCSALTSIYVPAGVATIGNDAFTTCTALKYMALLHEAKPVEAGTMTLAKGITLFVPKAQMGAYGESEYWGSCAVEEYTGIPTVTAAPASRLYSRSNGTLTFTVTGAPINGVPVLTCDAVATSPVGQYPIVVEAGTITNAGLQLVNGVLTVEPYALTLTAKSYTRNIGEENPVFEFSNSSLRNREKIDEVLLRQPTIECDAKADSPAGTYEIRIYGAEATNYEISYVNGMLTVIDPDGIRGVEADGQSQPLYDLSGRRVTTQAKRGVYISAGKKLVK